jgi:hypothetical protein
MSLLLGVFVTPAWSQEGEGTSGTMISGFIGPYLPNQIEGVTEIVFLGGLRVASPLSTSTMLEVGAGVADEAGVQILDLSFSLRGDFPIQDMFVLAYAGVDTLYYSPDDEDYRFGFGAHLGGGILSHLASNLFLRTEMKFTINPGTSLYVGFGFEIQI